MNILQFIVLCLCYHGVLLDVSEEVVYVVVVDVFSYELLDVLYFVIIKCIEIICWMCQ